MSDEPTQPQSPPRTGRRSSFAGQPFADLFNSGGSRPSIQRGTTENGASSSPPAPQPVGPISKAAQQAQQRRLSLTTLGLSGSPNQTSPFTPFRPRNDSIGSSNSASIDESAIAEDDGGREQGNSGSPTNSPFARRTSFGARALRDIRAPSFNGQSGGVPGSPGREGSTEGFNWSDNLRSRAERTSSIAGQGGFGSLGRSTNHDRTKSATTMEQPPVAPPKPKEKPRPDHFQERILKGDFYMD